MPPDLFGNIAGELGVDVVLQRAEADRDRPQDERAGGPERADRRRRARRSGSPGWQSATTKPSHHVIALRKLTFLDDGSSHAATLPLSGSPAGLDKGFVQRPNGGVSTTRRCHVASATCLGISRETAFSGLRTVVARNGSCSVSRAAGNLTVRRGSARGRRGRCPSRAGRSPPRWSPRPARSPIVGWRMAASTQAVARPTTMREPDSPSACQPTFIVACWKA